MAFLVQTHTCSSPAIKGVNLEMNDSFKVHLRYIEGLLTEYLPQFLPPLQSFMLIGQVDNLCGMIKISSLQIEVILGVISHLNAHSPDFPRNVFRWKWPPFIEKKIDFESHRNTLKKISTLCASSGRTPRRFVQPFQECVRMSTY